MSEWHIITGEFPPTVGGVGDYTAAIATRLAAAGDKVHVWCPGASADVEHRGGVHVHRCFGHFNSAALAAVGQALDTFSQPRRILVQWVPHAFGYRSLNLGFCRWLLHRARKRGDCVELMVHEAFLSFREGNIRQDLAAVVHRVMTIVLLRAASRAWVSIPEWIKLWNPYRLGREIEFRWLPIPSTIPVVNDPEGVASLRTRYAALDDRLVGQFGMHGRQYTDLWAAILPKLLAGDSRTRMLLMGAGSFELRDDLVARAPEFAARVIATGALPPADVSRHLSACDVLVQPFPDGVTTRRTSAMAGLAHGLALVTSGGRLTEPFWEQSRSVVLTPPNSPDAVATAVHRVLANDAERRRLGGAARTLYDTRFAIEHVIRTLRAAPPCA